MKRKLLTAGALLAVALIALVLTFWPTRPAPNERLRVNDGVVLWGIDPNSFEVTGPASAKERLASLNTPARIEERRRATLLVRNREEYFRQFPKTPERVKEEEEAAFSIARPVMLKEKLAQETPEKRAEIEKALQALLDINGPKDQDGKPKGKSASDGQK